MKKITITIETTNDAFVGEDLNVELGRILSKMGMELSAYSYLPTKIADINGNNVGTVEIEHDNRAKH